MNILKSLIVVLLLFFLSCSKDEVNTFVNNFSLETQFVKTYGGAKNDAAQSIIKTDDDGYVVLGHTQSFDLDIKDKTNESYDYWVLKFDKNDKLVWSKTFGGTNDDRGRDIIQTLDGGFVVSGFSRSSDQDVTENFGSYDYWILKLDSKGEIIWEKTFGFLGTDQSFSIIQTSDNGYLLTGVLDVSNSGGQGNSRTSKRHAGGDYWVIKLSASGNKEWSRYYGGANTDTLYDAIETQDNSFLLVGSSDSNDVDISKNNGSYDFWVVKIDAKGDVIWEKSYGGSEIDEAFSITKTLDNNFIITGNSRSNDKQVAKNNGSSDIWIIKINTEGKLIWEKNYGGTSFDISSAIIASKEGGFFIVGNSRSSDKDLSVNNGNNDVWILKISSEGNIEWEKSIGGSEIDIANSIIELNNKEIIIVGESWSSDKDITNNKGFSDLLIIKLK